MQALRIRPVAAVNPPRLTPPEGMTIAGRYIAGNVPLPQTTPTNNPRQ